MKPPPSRGTRCSRCSSSPHCSRKRPRPPFTKPVGRRASMLPAAISPPSPHENTIDWKILVLVVVLVLELIRARARRRAPGKFVGTKRSAGDLKKSPAFPKTGSFSPSGKKVRMRGQPRDPQSGPVCIFLAGCEARSGAPLRAAGVSSSPRWRRARGENSKKISALNP